MSPHLDIVRVIQLAVAPVFLLAGIGALLNVLTNRLARVIDRARQLEARVPITAHIPEEARGTEHRTLKARARYISLSIALCTLSLLLVCTVVTALFVDALFGIRLAATIAFLFVACMLALIVALVFFLREIFLATANLRGPI
jgi:hypothetical protein